MQHTAKNLLSIAVAAILIVCNCGVSHGQMSATAAIDAAKYTHIPGTRVYMEIPGAFEISPYGIGILTNERYDQIVVMDNIHGNYYKNAETYTLAALDELTPEPVYFEELKIEGYDAKFSMVESNIYNEGNMTLLFGDSTFCTMLTVIYNHKSSPRKEEFKNALQSVRYNRDMLLDPADFIPFEIQENSSGYSLVDYSMGIFVYEKENPFNPVEEYKIYVQSMPISPDDNISDLMKELKHQTLKKADKHTFYTYDETIFWDSSINGYLAREIVLRGDRIEDKYPAYYLGILGNPDSRQAVNVTYKFSSHRSGAYKGDFDDDIADVKTFLRSIILTPNPNH